MIETAKREDIDQLVDLHLANLQDGIFPILGKDILRDFYSHLFSNNDCFNFISKEGNYISGFAIATTNMRNVISSFKRKYFAKILIKAINMLLKDPLLISQLWQTMNYKIASNNELIYIYVDINKKRKNLSTSLLQKINEEFLKRGKNKYQVTVSTNNIIANNFYKKNNFKLIYQIPSRTLVRNLYLKEL